MITTDKTSLRRSGRRHCLPFALALILFVLPAAAQTLIPLPEQSQRATAGQRLAITDINITYHRPLVAGRKIWGGLVPYGQVWRAGANENTVIRFSDPVVVEGQPLAAGAYGLHMMPGPETWTIIFSRNSSSWGSFSYDKAEDALRVNVKPHPADMQEALSYEFDDLKPDSALVTLRWEKLAVPFRVAATHEATLARVRDELRSGAQYTWQSWDEAASWLLQEKVDLDQALKWTDRSIQFEERFDNLATKAELLKAQNKPQEAATILGHALEIGSVQQIYGYGRGLQFQKRQAEALDMFRVVVKRYPDHRLGHLAQARLLSASGNFTGAAKEITAAQAASPNEQLKRVLDPLLQRLQASQDINN